MSYICPVCGYPELKEVPSSETTGGSYEICPSCGFQFGISDEDSGYSYEQWRQEWIAEGMPWRSIGIRRPAKWDPTAQLNHLSL